MSQAIMQSPAPNEAFLMQQNSALFQENHQRSQNEQLLSNEWQKANNEKMQLTNVIEQPQSQVLMLENWLKQVENKENTPDYKKSESKEEYLTDEEDLARETEWIRVKDRHKKRKMDTSLTPPSPQSKSKNFSRGPQKNNKKIPSPPPIIVEGVKDYDEFFKFVSEYISEEKFNTKLMSRDTIKVNLSDGETYRRMVDTLKKTKLSWHSYEDKQNRPIRVIVKKLHHTCHPDRIICDLRNRGYKALVATNKLEWRTKEPLDMTSEDINRIHAITHILRSKVEIQPLRVSKLIPQCKRCQAYGHTQKYCNKEPRCVKCIGKHLTKDCTKSKDSKPKCVHCGEEHPASYRGCRVAIELQKIKTKAMKNKQNLPTQQGTRDDRQPKKTNKNERNNEPRLYSQIIQKNINIPTNEQFY